MNGVPMHSGLQSDGDEPTDLENLFSSQIFSNDEREDETADTPDEIQQIGLVRLRQAPRRGIAFQVWPAASLLCRFLDDQPEALGGKPLSQLKILELGAGVGLVGLHLAARGACEVVLTDLPEVVPLLAANAMLNFSPDAETAGDNNSGRDRSGSDTGSADGGGNGGSGSGSVDGNSPVAGGDLRHRGGWISAAALTWGAPAAWQDDVRFANCDVVVAADCVYWESLFVPLLDTLSWFTAGGATVILAHVRRWKRDARFFRACARRMSVECLHEETSREAEEGNEEDTSAGYEDRDDDSAEGDDVGSGRDGVANGGGSGGEPPPKSRRIVARVYRITRREPKKGTG